MRRANAATEGKWMIGVKNSESSGNHMQEEHCFGLFNRKVRKTNDASDIYLQNAFNCAVFPFGGGKKDSPGSGKSNRLSGPSTIAHVFAPSSNVEGVAFWR